MGQAADCTTRLVLRTQPRTFNGLVRDLRVAVTEQVYKVLIFAALTTLRERDLDMGLVILGGWTERFWSEFAG